MHERNRAGGHVAYELIAFDMDGTLLDSRKEVQRSSVDAISEAVVAGKHVAIASGRCPRMVTMYRESIPGVHYAICCAGAIVFDLATGRVLSEAVGGEGVVSDEGEVHGLVCGLVNGRGVLGGGAAACQRGGGAAGEHSEEAPAIEVFGNQSFLLST